MKPANEEDLMLRAWHYQAWCGLCLGLVFLAQLAQGILLTNLLCVLLGALGIVSRPRWGSFLLLLGVAFSQSLHHFVTDRYSRSWGSAGRDLDLDDFLLTVGILGFVAGQHRLQGLWHHLWPPDPRERSGAPKPMFLGLWRRKPVVQHRRKEAQMRPQEFLALSMITPVLALAGMMLYTVTRPTRGWLGFPLGAGHFLILLWVLFLSVWMMRQALEIWQIWTQGHAEAQLYAQDQLWVQTRGELRRIARWRAWRQVEDQAADKPMPQTSISGNPDK